MRKILAGLLLFIASNVIASDYRFTNAVPVTGGTFTGGITTTQIGIASTTWTGGGLLTVGAGSTPVARFNSGNSIIFGSDSVLFQRVTGGSNSLNIGYGNTIQANGSELYIGTDTDYDINFRVNNVSKMLIDGTTGNVGISSSTPMYLLTMEAGGVGGYYSVATHQWTNGVSFAEYKENIKDIKLANPITSLKNIKLRQYNYKGQKQKVYGYIADELPKNLSKYMIADNGGLSMNGLFVFATATMQAQQAKIEDLEARITKLEKLLAK